MPGSEYGGSGPRAQMVQPKSPAALTAAEKHLLLTTTSMEGDPRAPVDPQRTAWNGLSRLPKHTPRPIPPTPVGDKDDTGGR